MRTANFVGCIPVRAGKVVSMVEWQGDIVVACQYAVFLYRPGTDANHGNDWEEIFPYNNCRNSVTAFPK